MAADKVTRKTWAKIAWIIALIGAVLMLLGSIMLLIGSSIAGVSSSVLPLGGIVGAIIGIIVAIVIFLLELDYIVLQSHLIRGILYIVLALFGPGGLLIIIAGILYILAEFLDK